MYRYINSFSISILFHLFLVFILFFSYKNISIKPTKNEKILEIKLVSIKPIKQKNSVILTKQIKHKKQKNIDSKVKQKIKKKKIKKKQIDRIKKIPVVKKIIKKVEQKILKEKVVEKKIINLPTKSIEVKKVIKKVNFEAQYIDENIKKIIELLKENLYYPRSARKRGVVGEVIVKFRLNKDSSINNIKIISSDSKILSRAAIKTIKNLSFIFPKPKGELLLQVPINYNLKR